MRNYLNFLNMYVWKYVDAAAVAVAVAAFALSCIITAHAKFLSIIFFLALYLSRSRSHFVSCSNIFVGPCRAGKCDSTTGFALRHNYRIECQSAIAFGWSVAVSYASFVVACCLTLNYNIWPIADLFRWRDVNNGKRSSNNMRLSNVAAVSCSVQSETLLHRNFIFASMFFSLPSPKAFRFSFVIFYDFLIVYSNRLIDWNVKHIKRFNVPHKWKLFRVRFPLNIKHNRNGDRCDGVFTLCMYNGKSVANGKLRKVKT